MSSDYERYEGRPPSRGGGNTLLIVLGVVAGIVVICGGVIVVCIAAVIMLGKNASGTFSNVSAGPTLAGMPGAQIGQPAPNIAGEDLDGKAFKLSDYKGKVVLLDFWGNW